MICETVMYIYEVMYNKVGEGKNDSDDLDSKAVA